MVIYMKYIFITIVIFILITLSTFLLLKNYIKNHITHAISAGNIELIELLEQQYYIEYEKET